VVEFLPSKHKAPRSNHRTARQKIQITRRHSRPEESKIQEVGVPGPEFLALAPGDSDVTTGLGPSSW
jgi:hypothetical protein